MISAQAYAEQVGVNYRTVLNWLKAEAIPGARQQETPRGPLWEIPANAVKPQLKRGPKKVEPPTVEPKAPTKQRAKAAPQPTLFDAKPKKKAVKKS